MSARASRSSSFGPGPGFAVAAAVVVMASWAALLPSHHDHRGAARGRSQPRSRLELGPGPGLEGFARAIRVRPFVLPADHGPHYEFQTEWWYYTGNLTAADRRQFGFQLTFFRRGLSPGPPPGVGLVTNQVYFAHFAITDVSGGTHLGVERFERGAGGLAGAAGEPFAVWLENWRVEAHNADGSAVRLVARDDPAGLSLDLDLEARKPLVTHGDRGLSPKSQEAGNASYYVGYTRMAASGRIATSSDKAEASPGTEVTGEAWFDHEWSTSALGPRAVGWDWFSLQLDDGRDLMYFQIRRDDGTIEPLSGGTLVDRNGTARRLASDDVRVDVLERWTSPETGVTYPSRWRLRAPAHDLDLLVEPWLHSQEMRVSFTYWEGAVRVSGWAEARHPSGQGYVELTGYGHPMRAAF
jgi:predicted secreted hydrolase